MPFPLYCAAGIVIAWIAARLLNHRARLSLYLAGSLAFYCAIGGWFVVVLLTSALFNYAWGGVLRKKQSAPLLAFGVAANVALLSIFKYLPGLAAPFVENSPVAAFLSGLMLPIGISFWTFQGLSYLFDQYRGEELDPSLTEFLVYMTFGPTVLSGPICRLSDLLPQLRTPSALNTRCVTSGAQSVWIGLWMIAIARLLGSGLSGQGVNQAFDTAAATLSGSDVWIMLAGYGFQLFFDFAGYSRLVIGLALLFAIRLPENFDRPFVSLTPTQFWQRWHMSLSFWIRDYVFMPLAMMRREMWWRNSVLVFSMVVFGLWHKATWLFLLWGLYQGLLLLGHRLWQQHKPRAVQLPKLVSTGLSWALTFSLITFGWILFRANDAAHAWRLAVAALGGGAGPNHLPVEFYGLVLAIGGGYFAWVALTTYFQREDREPLLGWIPVEIRFAAYGIIFYLQVFRTAEPQTFAYFQF
jgi:alginate O-acetyltransferase complex protein AlgI